MSDQPDKIMLDIETLGLQPGCVVLSIGAARFDIDGIGDTFERSISRESCREAGLTEDDDTIEWWEDQNEEAREVLTGGDDLAESLARFNAFYRAAPVSEVWANSPTFDCKILEHAYDQVNVGVPWEYYEERCYRTINEMPIAVDVDHDGTLHDALDDAVRQAKRASAILQKVNGRGRDAE